MDKKEFNKIVGKSLRAKRTELGGATAGCKGSGVAVNIAKQLGYGHQMSVYNLELGNTTVSFVDFMLYCRTLQMSADEIAQFSKEIIMKMLKK